MYEQTMRNFQIAISSSVNEIWRDVLSFLPVILGAVLLVGVGFMLGNWFKSLITKSLEMFNLSKVTQDTAVAKFLDSADVKKRVEEVFGEVVRWLTIAIFFIAAVNVLGLVTVSQFLSSILWYIPKVISAALVLAAGALIGGWVERVVKGAVGSASLATGRLLGKISGYVIVVFAILAAISELGIAEKFINTLFIGFVAMLSLGLGLAFGLGAKDVVSHIISDWYKDLKKDLK